MLLNIIRLRYILYYENIRTILELIYLLLVILKVKRIIEGTRTTSDSFHPFHQLLQSIRFHIPRKYGRDTQCVR